MMHLTTLGMSTMTADIFTPKGSASWGPYPAKKPTTAPNRPPITIGSPSTPTFSWSVSALISILSIPGIFSMIISTTQATGAI